MPGMAVAGANTFLLESHMRPTFLAFGLVAVLSGAVSGQLLPGDWLLTNGSATQFGLFRMNPLSGAVTPFVVGPTYSPGSVMMAGDNVNLFAGDAYSLTVDLVSPLGVVSPGTVVNSRPGGMALDQDGTIVAATEWGGIVRIDPVTLTETPLWTSIHLFEYGACIDGDTGDYIIAGVYYLMDGRLIRVNRTTLVGTIIATGLGWAYSVDFDPLTGDFLMTNGDPLAPLIRVFRTGGAASMGMNVPGGAQAARVDPETGNILVAGTSAIRLLSPTGSQLRSYPLGAAMTYVSGLEFYGSRKVSGAGPATAGSTYTLHFSFPGLANRPYLAALSLAMRPGIPLNDGTGRVISLRPDWLFNASVGGLPGTGITAGFSGTLSATGQATGAIHIPPGFPAGVRIFVSAVAGDPSAPSGLATADTWGFTTN